MTVHNVYQTHEIVLAGDVQKNCEQYFALIEERNRSISNCVFHYIFIKNQ